MILRRLQFLSGLLCAILLCLSSARSAQEYKVTAGTTPVPQALSAAVRAALAPASINVTGPSGPLCEIWLLKTIPAAAQTNSALGVNFGQIQDGSLVGAIHFDENTTDFRNKPLAAGTYTLRYALQPVDGNHQGVSDYRDFLLADPAALDTSTAVLPDKGLYAMSRKASGIGHPSVWSLVPADSKLATLPAIVHDTNEDLWEVFFQAPVGTTPVTMGLVVAGHAEMP